MESKHGALSDLPNLGPKSQAMLERAGITSVEQLRAAGAVAAYARACRANGNVSLNLLWALEGALSGMPWQKVSREHRASLLLALEDYQRRA
jgi:DNA transformation protein and related proteins